MEAFEYRYDVFALIILMGLIQGFFLGFVFLRRAKKDSKIYLGFLMLAFSILLVDILLSYTGWMVEVIWFNNITESVNFTLGPLFYLYFKSSLDIQNTKHDWTHFIFPAFFFLYSIMYFVQPEEIKLHDYLEAMHPSLVDDYNEKPLFPYDPFSLRGFVNQLTIISFIIYLVASALLLFEKKRSNYPGIGRLRIFWYLYLAAVLLLIVVKVTFGNDLGDHLVAAFMAVTIYVTDFVVIKRFVEEKTTGRYEKSALSEEQKEWLKDKIVKVLREEEFYKDEKASLSVLSSKINSSNHYVSQVINEKMGKTYFELLAQYRIDEACRLLKSDEQLTVEQVAFDVGYNSKSAFNKKFKEIKGETPREFREKH